jgi:beta-lysine N6-acetyltransferase
MHDTITKIGDSTIQDGSHNDRIYVMKLATRDVPDIAHRLFDMATTNRYSKIFVKAPTLALDAFFKAGYVVEAYIPGFYNGREDGYFVSKYLNATRAMEKRKNVLASALSKVRSVAGLNRIPSLKEGFTLREVEPKDAVELAKLYTKTFSTYPFPIQDPKYIRETMDNNIKYFGVFSKYNKLVAASSSEMDFLYKNVEMTDFATMPEYQGSGLSTCLLHKMEENVRKEGMKMAYTIARATSYPMNRVFSRAEYSYGGTLTNNTNICGGYESMNVWYKALQS